MPNHFRIWRSSYVLNRFLFALSLSAYLFPSLLRVSMGLTDRRKTAKNLADSRKNWKILTVSRKYGKKELTVKEIVP